MRSQRGKGAREKCKRRHPRTLVRRAHDSEPGGSESKRPDSPHPLPALLQNCRHIHTVLTPIPLLACTLHLGCWKRLRVRALPPGMYTRTHCPWFSALCGQMYAPLPDIFNRRRRLGRPSFLSGLRIPPFQLLVTRLRCSPLVPSSSSSVCRLLSPFREHVFPSACS